MVEISLLLLFLFPGRFFQVSYLSPRIFLSHSFSHFQISSPFLDLLCPSFHRSLLPRFPSLFFPSGLPLPFHLYLSFNISLFFPGLSPLLIDISLYFPRSFSLSLIPSLSVFLQVVLSADLSLFPQTTLFPLSISLLPRFLFLFPRSFFSGLFLFFFS